MFASPARTVISLVPSPRTITRYAPCRSGSTVTLGVLNPTLASLSRSARNITVPCTIWIR